MTKQIGFEFFNTASGPSLFAKFVAQVKNKPAKVKKKIDVSAPSRPLRVRRKKNKMNTKTVVLRRWESITR